MDIRQLRCFDAVLNTGAMTSAADLLGLTQPTVSITIAQLDREIGFTYQGMSDDPGQENTELDRCH